MVCTSPGRSILSPHSQIPSTPPRVGPSQQDLCREGWRRRGITHRKQQQRRHHPRCSAQRQRRMSSQDVQETLPELAPILIDPFDRSQSNSQDGARTPSVREQTSGTLRHAFMTAISATLWYRLTPLKAGEGVEGYPAHRRREGLRRCWR